MANAGSVKPTATGMPLVFRLFLLFGLLVIALFFIWYTQNVIAKLKEDQAKVVDMYARLWQLVTQESTTGQAVSFIFDEIIQKSNIPIIITDSAGTIQFWRGLDEVPEKDLSPSNLARVRRMLETFDDQREPLPIRYQDRIIYYFHYGDPKLVRQLTRMPWILLSLFGLFLLVAFIGYRNIKRSEQRFIWVGMAKETAHQLGTPLSSLLGWLEILKSHQAGAGPGGKVELGEITGRMENDVIRLQKVAQRFGQIGSLPELKPVDLNLLLREAAAYFRTRLPGDGRGVVIRENLSDLPAVEANAELLTWVIENLLKNAAEAVDATSGVIEVTSGVAGDGKAVQITVTDNGRGIPSREQKKIFHAGYTTKKRGWGLGLTLAKRIVEEYHKGKLVLVESVPNQKTEFQISLRVGSPPFGSNGIAILMGRASRMTPGRRAESRRVAHFHAVTRAVGLLCGRIGLDRSNRLVEPQPLADQVERTPF